MKTVTLKLSSDNPIEVRLPDTTDVLSMSIPTPLADPDQAVEEALSHSIQSPSLREIVLKKLEQKPRARGIIVISDNTRPVPYKGKGGILWPVVKTMLDAGMSREQILVIVATGTHRALSEAELKEMLDPRVFEAGIPIKNHDCLDSAGLVFLGTTRRGSRMYISRDYLEADIKVLTGLVESHFMAGASGGRKSVCPGLVGEESTFIFHGAEMLSSPSARDLVLEGNPCHEESLEVAKRAGVDYIVNVTLDPDFRITGIFAGDLEAAHIKAVDKIKEYVSIPIQREYDLVISHAGFVGINHYQAAKAAVVALGALKPDGYLILAASNSDRDPVGSANYRSVLHLLNFLGTASFNRLIRSPDWSFIPDQWEVQMWSKLFEKIPMDRFIYYSPFLSARDYAMLPGTDGNAYLKPENRYAHSLEFIPTFVEKSVETCLAGLKREGKDDLRIAYLNDGPYGILIPYGIPIPSGIPISSGIPIPS
ncbi:MAG TPA: nickel-dependent lactate racemase [Spirochaetia bacterium]|nr:nickel-dependent lactate racemase [Spirochaetia bacterium]